MGSLTLLACALVSGLVASIEAALVGLPQSRIKQAVHDKLGGARTLAAIMEAPARVWATLQLD